MQKIIRIARLELSILFYSPIAWLVLVIFTIQAGITFTDQLFTQETSQQLERPLSVLTKVLFAGDNGMLKSIQDNLYLYIPLLTMGLMSRETSSGSIKLLLSSPVTVTEIVMGKFLSMMAYAFILVLIMLGFTLAANLSIEALDIKFVIGGIFGLYLLICAYTAIGLFMSSLTSYQVVAAISTLAVLAALNFIGEVGQTIDFVRDLTYWFSMLGRTDKMVNGLITSKDVIYFLLVIALFLVLTIMKLNSGRQTRTLGSKIMRYSSLVVLMIILGYVTSLPALTGYYDTTRFKDRTLTEASQELVKRFDGPVSLASYANVNHYTAGYGAPANRISDISRFEQYQRFMPGLKMDYVSYYDKAYESNESSSTLKQKAKKSADALNFKFADLLTPKQIKEKVDLTGEEGRFVRMFSYKGKSTALRMFDDMFVYPGEPEISAALKRLLDGPAKVGFLTGNEERSTEENGNKAYKMITKGVSIRGSLINQGFDIINLDLSKVKAIPDSLCTLVLADPTVAFTPEQLNVITAYLDKGGNMMIAGEPGRQHLLNPLLAKLGIALLPGTLIEESENFEPNLLQVKFTKAAEDYKFSFYDGAVMAFVGTAGLTYTNDGPYKKAVIAVSNGARGWNKLDNFDPNDKIVFNPAKESKAAYPVALAVTRNVANKEQKILVIGDTDFMSNVELTRNNLNTVNTLFTIKMFRWFSDGIYPVSTPRPKATDTKILVSRTQINYQKALFLGVIPLLISIFGGMTLIRRKRK
ncbi:Gldg family protein [Pedobacter sp.]|uniref:Gldg family protein n=1 Tax=Pedobacter sp. TaxID=1411316 RepID=UPI003D7F2001